MTTYKKYLLLFLYLLLPATNVASLAAEPNTQQEFPMLPTPLTKSPENEQGGILPSARLPIGSSLHDYDDIVSPDMESAGSFANRARVALRNGNYLRAMELAKKSLQKDDDDPDVHAVYAESIEAKLEHQTEKDSALYKTCVHEWLIVYRNEAGEEKGMTIKGINVMGTFWNDDFRGGLAKKHLKKLTGYLPKAWETDNRYMARVLKTTETKVTGKIKSARE